MTKTETNSFLRERDLALVIRDGVGECLLRQSVLRRNFFLGSNLGVLLVDVVAVVTSLVERILTATVRIPGLFSKVLLWGGSSLFILIRHYLVVFPRFWDIGSV